MNSNSHCGLCVFRETGQHPTAEPDAVTIRHSPNSPFSPGQSGLFAVGEHSHLCRVCVCVYPQEKHSCVHLGLTELKLVSVMATNFKLSFHKFVVTSVNQAGPERCFRGALSVLSFQNRIWVQQRHSQAFTGLYFSLSQLTQSCKKGFTSRQTLLSFRVSLYFGSAW